jgi:hypothetical protein
MTCSLRTLLARRPKLLRAFVSLYTRNFFESILAINASIPKVRIHGEAHEQITIEALRATAANISADSAAAE